MRTIFIFLLLMILFPRPVMADENAILGLWQTEDQEAVIAFTSCDTDRFCGSFYWIQNEDPQNPSLDDKNNRKELRKRPLCGLTFIGGLKTIGKGVYEGGWLYSPRHGSSFHAQIKLITPNELELRGYVFFPTLGGTQIWRRVLSSPSCTNTKAPITHKNKID